MCLVAYVNLLLQVFVRARDGGGRLSVNTGELRFQIQRNIFPPVFIDTPYNRTIFSSLPVSNDAIIDINATDSDTIYYTLTYSLIGDPISMEYFDIEPNTGRIYLIKGLDNTDVTQFNVRL